ncbi:MAG: hypothetical protein Q7S71_02455 [Candidatus Nitrotoga sp.]|nr:hypothetical protein [Candidatus Nitrotoga sp.]
MNRLLSAPAEDQAAWIGHVIWIFLDHFTEVNNGSYVGLANAAFKHSLDGVVSVYQFIGIHKSGSGVSSRLAKSSQMGLDTHGTRLRTNSHKIMKIEVVLSSNLLWRHHFAVDVERASRRLGRTVHQHGTCITMI